MAYDTRYLRGKAAIVGAADEVSPTGELHLTERELEVKVIHAALEDAGLKLSDVDGLFCTGMMMPSLELAEHLGIRPRYTDSTMTGGSSFEVHVEHAAAAIALGLCEVAVSVYAQTPRSKGGLTGGMAAMMNAFDRKNPPPFLEWEMPAGLMLPAGAYALAASRHQHLYGTTSEQLAQIAVSTRKWAQMNPRARYQEPMSIEDVLNSPLVCDPLHRYDCCLVTDGAGAVVITSAERARHLKKKPVYVLGAGTHHDHAMMISEMPELTVTPGAVSAPKAFNMAGVTPKDIDLVMTYDSFTITVLMSLEDMGFCPKGEGGRFVEDGKLGPGGALPTNTNGGGLSYTHPGMYGMFLLVEATKQLRGEGGPRQVPDAKLAVAHGVGGVLSACSTVVLGTEETL
ncbi:MAG: transporter [Pseudomonadota bacterium]|jgi:acetyl-CoA acetyltransferase